MVSACGNWTQRLRPHRAEDMGILGAVSASVRGGGGAPPPVQKRWPVHEHQACLWRVRRDSVDSKHRRPTLVAPVFTAAQAGAGRAVYDANCANCHMPDLAGRNEAPPLAGGTFLNAWRNRSTKDLFDLISATMPPNAASLSTDQYLAIASYILQANGAAAGAQALT